MLGDNLQEVRQRIAEAAKAAGNAPDSVKLIAVTKTHGVDVINEAISLGVTDIGENKVQEVCEKIEHVSPVNWHLIGHLQTNKVKHIVDKVSLIHSVDSIKLLDEIEKQSKLHNKISDVLIQVNISGEETKFGIQSDDIERMIEHTEALTNVKIRGLMTIAPIIYGNFTNKIHFDNIRRIFIDIQAKKYDNSSMEYLSMGMSGDFEEAIRCGSNMVRVGSAIFGQRDYR